MLKTNHGAEMFRSPAHFQITHLSIIMFVLPSAAPLKVTPLVSQAHEVGSRELGEHVSVCMCLPMFSVCTCVRARARVYVITVPQNTLWKVFMPLTGAVKNLEMSAALMPLP